MNDYTMIDINRVIDSLREKKEELKKRYSIIRNNILAILLVIVGITLYLLFESNMTAFIIVAVVTVILVIFIMIGSEMTLRQKLIKSHFNQEVMNLYNLEQDKQYVYKDKVKFTNQFNKDMGLFSRAAGVSTTYQITGDSNGIPFDLRQLTLTVSTGNSSQVVFSGIYILFKTEKEKIFQVRSHGKPSLKKTKFMKEVVEDKRIFLQMDDSGRVKDKYNRIFDRLQNEHDCKKSYIASNEKEVHVAFTFREKQKYPKNIHRESFQQFYHNFTKSLIALDMITENMKEVF